MTTPDEFLRRSYDDWHGGHEPDLDANAPWYRMVKAFLRPEKDMAGRRILEIGCGLGSFAIWIANHTSRPASVVAADFSAAAIAKAVRLAASQESRGIEWTVADIQNLKRFGSEFDTVISCETVEHVPDPARAIRELARVLRPGGRLYLTTPNYLSTMGLYRGYCWWCGKAFDEGGQPLCNWTLSPKSRSWVTRAGLSVVTTEGVGHYIPVPGRQPVRLASLDRFRLFGRWLAHHTLVVAQKPGRR